VTRHPDAGVLAEFREGLLGRRRSARIRAHLAACPHCASVDAGLAEVTDLLAGAPAPRMPDHLIARLDSALAAEAARRQPAMDAGASTAGAGDGASRPVPGGAAPQPDGQAGSSPPGGHGGRRGRRPASPRRPARLRPAMLGAAAAAIIVVAGAAYGLASLSQQQSGTSASGGSAAGRSGESRHSGVVNPPAEGQSGPQHSGGTPAPADLTPRITWQVIGSKNDYQPRTLASQAAGLARRYAVSAAPAQGASTPAGTTAGPQLRSCVRQITGSTAPQLVDLAHYRGQPATIIVQAPSAGQPGHVWVTGRDCSARHHELLGQATLPGSG
jgi:hypothetical protein